MEKLKLHKIFWLSLAAILVWVAWLVFAKQALFWGPIDTTKIEPATVIATLTAFVAVALSIERVGEVFIKLNVKTRKETSDSNLAALNKETVNLAKRLEMTETFLSTTPKPNAAQHKAFIEQAEQIRAQKETVEGEAKEEADKLAAIEAESAQISLKVTFIISLLVAISGLHFLESIFGGAPVSNGPVDTDQMKAIIQTAQDGLAADAKESVQALKTAIETGYKDAVAANESLQLWTFRAVDIVFTTGLLAGGSAGIREMLKFLKPKPDTPS